MTTITAPITMYATGDHHVQAILGYNTDDPYAVTLTLTDTDPDDGSGPIVWTFSRELLDEGLDAYAGDHYSDVRIRPLLNGYIRIHLSSPDGAINLDTPTTPVALFLGRTYGEVPPGFEAMPANWLEPAE